MNEKPESEEFEEEDAEDAAPGGEDVDVDHIMRDVDSQRRRAPKGAEPAWRRLERVMEERRTKELMSDFDDYEIAGAADDTAGDSDDAGTAEPGAAEPGATEPGATESGATESGAKGARKKKKGR
jgi:hypothetical protein